MKTDWIRTGLCACVALTLVTGTVFVATPLAHAMDIGDEAAPAQPPTLYELENLPKMNIMTEDATALPFDIRGDAMKEAALSYGMRGGLSWRTYEIRKELDTRAQYLDKVYNFRHLLIPAPSGLLIEPPTISAAENAMLIDGKGLEAAVADRIYNISANARIVSSPRLWNNYLERDWGTVEPPPDILRPNNDYEREKWIAWVNEGWLKGIEQADEIFES
ncbi:MAG: type IV secretion system DotC family protein, partial [Alphaproteobacteria bacterium]|nr:type IV secretion system DotC family protein [Alphaproteobacteria bacterium]